MDVHLLFTDNVSMNCICGREIEAVRVEYGYSVCSVCAKNGRGQQKYKGAMIFDHKTGGAISSIVLSIIAICTLLR